MDVVDMLSKVGDVGLKGVLVILVYVLAKDRQRLQAALVECLQSGGHLSDKMVDRLDDIG